MLMFDIKIYFAKKYKMTTFLGDSAYFRGDSAYFCDKISIHTLINWLRETIKINILAMFYNKSMYFGKIIYGTTYLYIFNHIIRNNEQCYIVFLIDKKLIIEHIDVQIPFKIILSIDDRITVCVNDKTPGNYIILIDITETCFVPLINIIDFPNSNHFHEYSDHPNTKNVIYSGLEQLLCCFAHNMDKKYKKIITSKTIIYTMNNVKIINISDNIMKKLQI